MKNIKEYVSVDLIVMVTSMVFVSVLVVMAIMGV
jgi:hypothetical protein